MQNARRAYKIRLCGHLRRYKKIVKKTYIIYDKFYNKFKSNKIFYNFTLDIIKEVTISLLPYYF